MAEKEVNIPGTSDNLRVVTKTDGTFDKAYYSNQEANVTTVVADDSVIALELLEQDVNNTTRSITTTGPYAYCTPIRDPSGKIIKWVCGGTGNKGCP